jgi:hypothetical protein
MAFFATNALADDCYDKLMSSGTDSNHFKYLIDDVGINYSMNEENAVKVLHHLRTKLGCKNEDMAYTKVSCKSFSQTHEFNVCHVETSVGFFYVMNDYVDSVNIIFNRWD